MNLSYTFTVAVRSQSANKRLISRVNLNRLSLSVDHGTFEHTSARDHLTVKWLSKAASSTARALTRLLTRPRVLWRVVSSWDDPERNLALSGDRNVAIKGDPGLLSDPPIKGISLVKSSSSRRVILNRAMQIKWKKCVYCLLKIALNATVLSDIMCDANPRLRNWLSHIFQIIIKNKSLSNDFHS